MDSKALFVLVAGLLLTTQAAQVDVTPKEVLVLPDESVTIRCAMSVPLQYCRVEIPGLAPLNLNPNLSNQDVSYSGGGLQAGQCGFTLNKVTERNNGPVRCMLGTVTDATESTGTAQLIVAKAPRVPEMDLSRGTDSVNIYKINDVLQASCVVRDGRPVANISWYLNEEALYNSDLSMPTIIDLAKENLQSKVQNMTRTLQAADNGKHLRCVAFHPAYPEGHAETSRQLEVKYAPLPQIDLHKFGYILGKPGLVSVLVESNPRPKVEWEFAGEKIRENENDQTGRIGAQEIRDLGNGRYNISLWISSIRKEDTERTYVLYAYNDMGQTQYKIMISTSPEPEGIELGIGGIIGIIVACLIILMVVFLLIFAKLTGRWCFSESHDTRNLGESSDTESADVRHRDAARNFPIKFTQFFKKANRDKVGDSDDPVEPKKMADAETETAKLPLEGADDKDKEEETKEGALVYAELDLVAPSSVKPLVKNDSDRTEYAEIVYSPHSQEEKKG